MMITFLLCSSVTEIGIYADAVHGKPRRGHETDVMQTLLQARKNVGQFVFAKAYLHNQTFTCYLIIDLILLNGS